MSLARHMVMIRSMKAVAVATLFLFPTVTTSLVKAVVMEEQTPQKAAVDFARLIGRLKTTPRTGWIRRNVPHCESVADHSWRVASLALLATGHESELDVSKCIQMAVLHDISECIIGDIAPSDNIAKERKQQMEAKAMDRLAELLERATPSSSGRSPRDRLMDLFHEYEERKSPEAVAVKDLDLLDMIIQADEYERAYPPMDLSEFFQGTPVNRFRTDSIRRIAEEVHQQRDERLASKATQPSLQTTTSDSGQTMFTAGDASFVIQHAKETGVAPSLIEDIVVALRRRDVERI